MLALTLIGAAYAVALVLIVRAGSADYERRARLRRKWTPPARR